MDHIRKHVLILEYFFRSTHTRVWPFPWRVLSGGISGILSYIKQWCTTFILITLFMFKSGQLHNDASQPAVIATSLNIPTPSWSASRWTQCRQNVYDHLEPSVLQLPHWSVNSLSSMTTEPPPPGYRILPCRLNSRRPQFLPQAFHFPPLQLTAQHILHSYRAGSAVCCKASNTMTRLQQPASGWEKHATEQERGFFVPKGLLIKCLTCHSAPGTAE